MRMQNTSVSKPYNHRKKRIGHIAASAAVIFGGLVMI